MEPNTPNLGQMMAALKHLARRLLTIGENRFELFMVELQEERVRLLQAILLALGVAALGLLAGIALTGAIVVLLWDFSPIVTLLGLTGLYGVAAIVSYRRLKSLLHNWENLPATLDQLRKDRAGLERVISDE